MIFRKYEEEECFKVVNKLIQMGYMPWEIAWAWDKPHIYTYRIEELPLTTLEKSYLFSNPLNKNIIKKSIDEACLETIPNNISMLLHDLFEFNLTDSYNLVRDLSEKETFEKEIYLENDKKKLLYNYLYENETLIKERLILIYFSLIKVEKEFLED